MINRKIESANHIKPIKLKAIGKRYRDVRLGLSWEIFKLTTILKKFKGLN